MLAYAAKQQEAKRLQEEARAAALKRADSINRKEEERLALQAAEDRRLKAEQEAFKKV